MAETEAQRTARETAEREAAEKTVTGADLIKLAADTDAKIKKLSEDSSKSFAKMLKDFGATMAASTTESVKTLLAEALPVKTTEDGNEGKEKAPVDPEMLAKLNSEKAQREKLQAQVQSLIDDSKNARADAERSDRESTIKAALTKAGVVKVELAYRAIRDDISRDPDDPQKGKLYGPDTTDFNEYVTSWVENNQEFLPARTTNATGATASTSASRGKGPTLDDIKPGNTAEENAKINQAIRDALPGGSAFVQ